MRETLPSDKVCWPSMKNILLMCEILISELPNLMASPTMQEYVRDENQVNENM